MGVRERREREEHARLDSIMLAAEGVFAEKGYFAARMEDIAEAAELSKGAIYYYFKSKDEIYLQLLERESLRVEQGIRNRMKAEANFLETLEGIIHFYLEYFDENQGFLKMFLPCMCGFLSFEDKDILRRSTRRYEAHGEFIRESLRAKIRKEGLSLRLEELMMFLKTLQAGIGIKLLEGRRAEAHAAALFFIDLIKKFVKEAS